jgi:hypothetical protein
MDVLVADGDVKKGETSDVEVVMGAGGVVGEGVEAGLEKVGPGKGVENGDTIDSDGGAWMGEVVGASAVVVGAAAGGPFCFLQPLGVHSYCLGDLVHPYPPGREGQDPFDRLVSPFYRSP